MLIGDVQASIRFLKWFHPNGPWVLTAIQPDRKAISTLTFRPGSEDAMQKFLAQHCGSRNIYFSVNLVTRDLSKKAERTDIASVDWLHVDIDPRAGEDPAKEKERALSKLQSYSPPPTAIIDSGGGVQAFWRLEEPIRIGGDLGLAEDAKRWNIQIERDFQADNCHNIDRIMRLPGTINIPDDKKRKKGRIEALASVIETHDDRAYSLKLFRPATLVQTEDLGFSGKTVQISGNVPRLANVNDLPETVRDWVKVVIVQGHDPENPDRWPSRSECLYAICCALARAEISDELIYSIITDPDFSISESVLASKNPDAYARRQIERAREASVDPMLAELNGKYAVITDLGGKCRIVSEEMDHSLGRTRISRKSFDDFRNAYMNRYVVVGKDPKTGAEIRKPAGAWWLAHERRRQYSTVAFAPGRELVDAYNLWKGFQYEPKMGDVKPYLEHILENVCKGNQKHAEYLIKWMARAVQKPDTPGEVAVVLRGRQGAGKGTVIQMFGQLWGRHFLQVSNSKHLVGSFNSHLRDCVVLFADEAFYAGDKSHEGVLKTLVTEHTLPYEAKGIDVEMGPNNTHIMIASNSQWVVPAGPDDRRYFILTVGDNQRINTNYFKGLWQWYNSGGAEALLHHLMTLSISDFDVRDIPETDAKSDQKALSLDPVQEWWYGKLCEGRLLATHEAWVGQIEKQDLFGDFYNYMTKLRIPRPIGQIGLGKFLMRMVPQGRLLSKQQLVKRKVMAEGGWEREILVRPNFYIFPHFSELRSHWDKEVGSLGNWPEITAEQEQLEELPKKDAF
jgi:Family of unknown function (DUF5906)